MQVRRTDKIKWEAKFHGIEEYMVHAEEFYEKLEKKRGESRGVRRIFLATDEVNLLDEAKKKYPGYVFVSDNKISQSANLASRSSEDSLKGVIVDLHLLARSDFLVCTFTSNICRLAYEVMQHYHVDASSKVRSVDCGYHWHGQNHNSSGKSAKMPEYEAAENIHL
ncbi:alpha-(1,6)-fucosyltransferase-like [Lytechinus pictus]|uniref:alpha-(1,6)-fucosyltransferase-like n=1 Tax=Lytechinus pictus TaxID=7653 RepID=UPI0030B9DDF2